ncbi:pheromone-regulated protein prm10 [Coemansia sp. RSA 1853]|nr:pheromone-regulated protein prm10 [Coemansia sp. RSA 638]KAJ2540072.1 pheromone-regulated protein prm10 [Coemansia sp. RSA 1853]
MSHQDNGRDQSDPSAQMSSSTSSGSDPGLTMEIGERRTQSMVPDLDGAKTERPVLRLAMLSAQEKAGLQERARSEQPATAPVRGTTPLDLPASGYFAARNGISRSNTELTPPIANTFVPADQPAVNVPKPVAGAEKGRKKRFGRGIPALRFASRDSVHTIHSDHSDDKEKRPSRLYTPISEDVEMHEFPRRQTVGLGISDMPEVNGPGLRRRFTQARANLAEIGRAFNPAAGDGSGSESDSDTNASQDTEQRMEQLLDKHAANSPENPPTNNIAANNADITSTPDFYPVNPSTQNPGVIHVNMSGHDTARNIVDSILGSIGTSTSQHKQHTQPTPADLESGLYKGKSPVPLRRPDAFPNAMDEMMSPMGLGRTPTTLRGVYSNLNKLQSRMVEHQKKRDLRMQGLREKEEKRKREEERKEKRKREDDERREKRKETESRDERRWNPRERLERERQVLSTVGSRIRDIPEKLASSRIREIPEKIAGMRSGARTPRPQETESPPQSGENSFVLHGFHTMPRPESVATYLNSMSQSPQFNSTSQSPQQYLHSSSAKASPIQVQSAEGASTPYTTLSPTHSTRASPAASPAHTPGWDDILASSGMLTGGSISTIPMGGPGSRISTASTDSTLLAFEAEKQKILAQLADIFNRQNFLLLASRALMAFGAPLHRLEANLIAMALNLDVEATFAVLPGIILITFGDEDTRSSETYVVRGVAGYDMYRLGRTNRSIRRVLKSRISVGQGVKNLERILATPPIYPWWIMLLDYVVISFFICPLFWNGSWQDAGASALLGLMVGLLQLLAGRFNNYANLFEVSSAFLVSFVAALLQNHVCFGTVSFAGIAMLLPGLALTTSIIEMASRNMISGTVRLVFALCRCFMLGYGISVGSMLGSRVLGLETSIALMQGQIDSTTEVGNCLPGPSKFWWFMFLPVLSLAFNVSISAHWRQWPFMMISGCLAYTVSYFASMSEALSPLAPAIAAFAMGLFANILASFYNHRSAVEPILGGVQLLVPGSLGLKTVLSFITSSGTSSGSFLYNIFATSLGVSVGLFLSGMCVFPNRRKRVGLMTF